MFVYGLEVFPIGLAEIAINATTIMAIIEIFVFIVYDFVKIKLDNKPFNYKGYFT